MAKSPPEKLAAALRANLKRRKQGPAAQKAPQTGAAAKPLAKSGNATFSPWA